MNYLREDLKVIYNLNYIILLKMFKGMIMLNTQEQSKIRAEAVSYFEKAGIYLTDEEKRNKIQIVDFGTEDFYEIGLVILTFINTLRYCGRFILFFPGQCVAEHWHPDINDKQGKEETFRVIWGKAYAYREGKPTENIMAKIPKGREKYFISRNEIVLNPGDQYTIKLGEKHWWQAGGEGVVALEVSSQARDEFDLNTDKTLHTQML